MKMKAIVKRLLVFGVIFLLPASAALFAENAHVMPARTGRFFAAPSFITFDRNFDEDGNRTGAASTRMFNMGFAVEYGLNSWITAAVQWAPAFNLWSAVDTTLGAPSPLNIQSTSDARIADMGDIFIGAKIQVIGLDAPSRSDRFRLAFGPGVKLPLPAPDFRAQLTNMRAGDPVTVATMDNHVFGVGLRSFFDFIVSEFFYINLFNEFIFYPQRGKFRDLGIQQAIMAQNTVLLSGLPDVGDFDVNFWYELTFEIEPTFVHRLNAPMIMLEAGLPLTHFFTPGYTVLNVPHGLPIPLMPQDQGMVHRFSIGPNVSAFFMDWPVPMEFRLSYSFPVWGINTPVRHLVGLQIRAYFRM